MAGVTTTAGTADIAVGGGNMITIPTSATNGKVHGHTSLTRARLVCLDIETGHADKKSIENEISRWKPSGNAKDEDKIQAAKERFAQKTKEKSALLDASPIACISVRTDRVGVVFNAMDKKNYIVDHSQVISGGNEIKMLIDFREWLDTITDDKTVLIGFNIFGFDLPRIRAAFMRHRLKLPQVLTPRVLDDDKQPIIDVMRMFLKGFTADCAGDFYISLQEVEHRLGLPEYKDKINGAEIPDLIEKGEIKKVLTYCAVDTMSTLQAYMLMSSLSPEMA